MDSQYVPQTLKGKVAIITGASRGLGAGFAYELAKRGAKIVATYTSPSSEKLVSELSERIASLDPPSQCIGVKADLKEESSPAEIVRHSVAAFGAQIDILVNNAGMEIVKPYTDFTVSDFDSIFYLNVRAPLLLLQAVKPYLPTSGGGRIINISSVGARCGFKNLSLYCASKAALEGLTRSWAAELGVDGHTVNAVNPGPVQSDLLNNIPREIVEMQKNQTPAGNRLGEVDDVSQIVAWLASEESRWITGQALSASGGLEMY
ncbi:3-oxoacyl-acyl-carrier- reductase [Fusarium longipes]|uniref:3-oxoacyl-acyl-carrier-reductase n=1 Tax=Fusarium longipes TaxID=694270 RepID=A0A395SXU2_9HYPO|nr:3-oxoacyl-acyl-carrier- reductase [Fusarium longipes]